MPPLRRLPKNWLLKERGKITAHIPVLADEVIDFLRPVPGGMYLDCTIGAGGHSQTILKRVLPGGKLLGIDRDGEMLNLARERLKDYRKNLELVVENFANLKRIIPGEERFDGVLYDLGLSILQIEKKERGFSFSVDGPLDMRMDRQQKLTAKQIVNEAPREKLCQILKEYGEEYDAERIATAIIKERKFSPISTTFQLKRVIAHAVPKARKRIHPATKTFQALRIAVNGELEALGKSLPQAINLLKKRGRIAVISFHSLEDRITKHTFQKFNRCKLIKIVTRSPVVPAQMERCINPRSRSAKLRVAEKL